MVGNLELVLPELEAQNITAKDFFMIHLGLSSLLAPAQRAWHLHNAQECRNQRAPHPASPFMLGMVAMAAKFRAWCEDFQQGCHFFPFGPSANHIGVPEVRGEKSALKPSFAGRFSMLLEALDMNALLRVGIVVSGAMFLPPQTPRSGYGTW